MEEREIDAVLADALVPGDLIYQDGSYVTVTRVESGLDGCVYVHTDDGEEEPAQYEWDAVVPLYGY